MNRIEEMIKVMCPEGVKKVRLGEVCTFTRGRTITAKNAIAGNVPVIAGGQTPSYYHNESNRTGETITVAGSGAYAGFVSFWNIPIWVSDAFSVDASELVLTKYVLYFLKQNQNNIFATQKGAGVPHVHGKDIENFQIPLPPLPIQQEIVNILDKFTALQQNLEDELKLRQKQYEHYREKLLTFEDGECEWKKIGEITRVFSASRVHKNEWQTSGVPFWRSSDVMSYHNGVKNSRGEVYISYELYEKLSAKSGKIHKGDLLVTGGGSIGMPYIVPNEEPLYVKDADLLCIVKNNVLDNGYLFRFMLTDYFRGYLAKITHDASIAHYTITQIKDTPVPVPPLDRQLQITQTLDHFESLISNLKTEIELRKKQYEYYREKLLTF